MSDCAASSPTSSTAAPLIDGAAESAAERMAPAARHLERVAQREDAARQLAQRRERGETLSKAEQKRLRKFETRDEYKEIRKMERKRRKLAREAKASQQAQDEHQLPRETVGVERSLPPLDELKLRAWEFWRGIGSPTCVLAPMVNQSELPFRLLARKHGAQLTYTPMLHSVHFAVRAWSPTASNVRVICLQITALVRGVSSIRLSHLTHRRSFRWRNPIAKTISIHIQKTGRSSFSFVAMTHIHFSRQPSMSRASVMALS